MLVELGQSGGVQGADGGFAAQGWRVEEQLPPRLGTPTHGLCAEPFGHAVYTVGGISDGGRFNGRVWRLDLRTTGPARRWEKLPSMPCPRSGFGTAVLGGSLYVVGGWDGKTLLDSALCFSFKTHGWSSAKPMQRPRYALGCAVLDGRLYAVGGGCHADDGSVIALSDVERFDPLTNGWVKVASLRQPRMAAGCVVSNGRLVVLGGQDSAKTPLSSVEMYDPKLDVWTTGPEMPEGRTAASACVLLH